MRSMYQPEQQLMKMIPDASMDFSRPKPCFKASGDSFKCDGVKTSIKPVSKRGKRKTSN